MRGSRRRAAALLVLLALALTGCRTEPVGTERYLFEMDTVMLLTAYGPEADAGLDAAAEVIGALNRQLDPEAEDSEIYALNHAGGAPVAVSPALRSMLRTAAEVWQGTGGALDPTVYPLVKVWGFLDENYRVPDADEISARLPLVDMGAVRMENGGVALPDGMELGLGAVAKGYAGQAAADAMREAGVTTAVISLGGNVQTLGETNAAGRAWTVAVQDPFDLAASAGILRVGETAVVTSGGYQRFFDADGVRYHHIFDPKTGCPAQSDLASVTVICPDGARADALSTALFVLGEEGALAARLALGGFELVLITQDRRILVTGGLAFEAADGFTLLPLP